VPPEDDFLTKKTPSKILTQRKHSHELDSLRQQQKSDAERVNKLAEMSITKQRAAFGAADSSATRQNNNPYVSKAGRFRNFWNTSDFTNFLNTSGANYHITKEGSSTADNTTLNNLYSSAAE
jgi:hypothetical protein